MTEFIWRVHMIIPAHQTEAAADAAAAVLPGGPDERRMFGVPITAESIETASPPFYGCSTLLTDAQRRQLDEALQTAGVQCRWVALRADDPAQPVESKDIEAHDDHWSWEKTVAAVLRKP